jgi:signal transduction histidine kinase
LHRRSRARHRREERRLRQDIAQDLHDEVGSNLGSITILSQMALDEAPDGEAMRRELEEIQRVAQQTTASMRDIVWLISPGEKTTDDLAARLRSSAASLLAGMEWTWSAGDLRGTLPLDAQRDVLLILKEALHNVRKHAGAKRVDIRLDEPAGRSFRMEIADEGRGFDAGNAAGHGLANMQRRAQRLRGQLIVDSAPGRGTRLTLTLPLS